MNQYTILALVFGPLLTAGAVAIFIVAWRIFYKYTVQERRCTETAMGTVRRYTLISYGGEMSGIHLPIIYYVVNGIEYKVVGPEYKGYCVTSRWTNREPASMEYEERRQGLYVHRVVNSNGGVLQNPLALMYPVGAQVSVCYDPANPRLAYAVRYCNRKAVFYLLNLIAMGILILAVFITIYLLDLA